MSAPADRAGDPEADADPPAPAESDLVTGSPPAESDLVTGSPPAESDLVTGSPPAESDLVTDTAPKSAEKNDPVTAAAITAGAAEATGDPDPAQVVGPPRDLRRVLRRFAPAAIAIAFAVFASPLADRWPSKQTLEIALDAPGGVTRVSIDVAHRGEAEPVYSATWTFEPGTAPQRIRAEWSAPDGAYDATIGVIRAGAAPTDETKHVDLDGNRVTLFLR